MAYCFESGQVNGGESVALGAGVVKASLVAQGSGGKVATIYHSWLMPRSRPILSVTTVSVTAGILALLWTVMGGPFWVFIGCFLLAFLWKVLEFITPLHKAARDGSPGLAQLLIKAGVNPNAKNRDGMTPLCVAAKEGHPEMARLLIEAGANLNATNKDSTTPLYIAVFLEHGETAKALMDAGAKLAITDQDNVTPLHSAVAKEDLTIIMALINMGFDVNAKDQNSMTPLHAAVTKGDMEMTKALISAGADLNGKDKGGTRHWTWRPRKDMGTSSRRSSVEVQSLISRITTT